MLRKLSLKFTFSYFSHKSVKNFVFRYTYKEFNAEFNDVLEKFVAMKVTVPHLLKVQKMRALLSIHLFCSVLKAR